MPPVKEPNAEHWIQDDLHTLLTAQLPAAVHRAVLEHQSHPVVPHVGAHVDGKLGRESK